MEGCWSCLQRFHRWSFIQWFMCCMCMKAFVGALHTNMGEKMYKRLHESLYEKLCEKIVYNLVCAGRMAIL